MWKKAADYLRSPRQRTKLELISSALFITAALLGKYALGFTLLHDVFMVSAAIVAGSGIAARAVRSLRNRHISIELLVSVAALGALLIGEYWEAAAVTFLFVFGAFLEARTLAQTRKVLGDLLDMAPVTAVVLRDGKQVEIEPSDVALGEVVLLKPGAKVPVDGEVIAGASSVNESMITGEPMPEEKTLGAAVYAGTVNLEGMLQVRTTGTGADTTLARIIARVEEAQDEKAPTQRFIEKFARWYTPAIMLGSLLFYFFTRNIELALTLLVIACPGALVISTPVSVIAGIGRAARSGILIKGGEYLENAGRITALALDKTGTLTYGKPQLVDVLVPQTVPNGHLLPGRSGNPIGESSRWNPLQQEALFWAGAAESGSEHPLARAVTFQAEKLGLLPVPDEFHMVTGKGIRAVIQDRSVIVGKKDWLESQGVVMPGEVDQYLQDLRENGSTAVMVALEGILIGILDIRDRLRPEVKEVLQQLESDGVRTVVMLTGDDSRTAQAVAKEAGIGLVRADLLPDDKLEAIRQLQAKGHVVAMVGDGINDAPALAAADLGIAMGAAGSGVAIETADIALMADDLGKVAEAIHLSRATLGNIRQNLVIALMTVSILLLGVLLDRIHMAGGMLVHQVSVLVVIANGMRLLHIHHR